jgi:hypothetical protein
MSQYHKDYIRDLAYLLREAGADAARESSETKSAFHEGREAAYREILAWMQHQADAFGFDREELCLAGFDALTGKLDPPRPEPPRDM